MSIARVFAELHVIVKVTFKRLVKLSIYVHLISLAVVSDDLCGHIAALGQSFLRNCNHKTEVFRDTWTLKCNASSHGYCPSIILHHKRRFYDRTILDCIRWHRCAHISALDFTGVIIVLRSLI